MTDVVAFLRDHPGEVVLLLLKQESGQADISADINRIVEDTLGDTLYRRDRNESQWPTLGECRGKALVLSRLRRPSAAHYSTVGWPDNCVDGRVWYARGDGYGVRIQDLYDKPQASDKREAVSRFLQEAHQARRENRTMLYLNFTSFVRLLWEPVLVGNTYMTTWLSTQRPRGAGVICMDAMTDELAAHIIAMNE